MLTFFRTETFSSAPKLHLTLRDLVWMLIVCAILLLVLSMPARAQSANTIFLTDRNGQIPFPILPPNRATGAAGSIDNMAIGSTTPRPGSFSTLKSSDGLTCATYAPSGTPAATDAVFFIATRPYVVVSASVVFSAAAGGASSLQLVKDTGTNAPGAGSDLLTNNTNAGFNLNGTPNTVEVGALTATTATKTLAAGDRLAVDYANAIQSSAGVVVTACMAPQ